MAKIFNVLVCFCVCLQFVNCQFGFLDGITASVSDALVTIGMILRPNKNINVELVKPPNINQDPSSKPDPHVATCKTVNGGVGTCVGLETCQPFQEMVKEADSNPITIWILRESHCGFDEDASKVCCPIEDDKKNQIETVTKPNTSRKPTPTLPQTTTLPPVTSTLPATVITTRRSRPAAADDSVSSFDAQVETCKAVNGGVGTCVVLETCQPFQKVMKNTVSNPITIWMLRESHCGFDGRSPKVCCPIEDGKNSQIVTVTEPTISRKPTAPLPQTTTLPPATSTLPPTTSTLPPTVTTTLRSRPVTANYDLLSSFGETCQTVNNTPGSCKDLDLCEPFLPLMNEKPNPASIALLKKAICGFHGKKTLVCCPRPGHTVSPQTDTTPALPVLESKAGDDFVMALPEPPHCGLSNISLDRVVGGIPAKLGAFPWMALLGYRDLSVAAGRKWMCGGVLVTTRHVLSAAHCLNSNLFIVRLGELDLAREDEGATPIDVPIKTMIKHDMYSRNNPSVNDVGVLVLAVDVQFTDLIKPICLFTEKTYRSETFEDYNPLLAGWGDTEWEGVQATHLQVAQLPVLSPADCQNAYSDYNRIKSDELFSERAMCAGYLTGKIDSCSGDSGGPLMLPLEVEGLTPRTYVYSIGVVSFGRQCAKPGYPGVYARVGFFMPWIEEQILGRAS